MRIASWSVLLLLPFVVATAGCKKKKENPAAPPPPIDAPKKDISSGQGPGPRKLVNLGEPFAAAPDGAAGQPGLAVDKDGKPLLAWVEQGAVQVRRWNGSAWDALGAPANDATKRASGAPALAFAADGAVLAGWSEMNKKDVAVFQIARWKDGAWTQLGELGGGQPISDPALAISSLGPIAVWREATAVPGQIAVHVRVHDGTAWTPLGSGVLVGAPDSGTIKVAPSLTTAGDRIVVAWIERTPAIVLNIRRWDAATSAWVEVPAPVGADGESTLSVAVAPDGGLTCSLSYNSGLRQLRTLAPGATEWKIIDVPEFSNGYVTGQRLVAAEDGRAIFTYPFGGRFAWWDGKAWTATPVGVMAPSPVVPAAASGPGGVVFVAWSAGPANGPTKVRVLEVKQQALGEP